jgi:hypothetical protein
MISSLKCIDMNNNYFDEIDESQSKFTRNEECNHFKVTMVRICENFNFKKYCLIIECKNCNTLLRKFLTKNKDSISYYCEKCDMPQCCINFSYENTMVVDEESNILKDEKNIVDESSSNINTGISSQISNEEKGEEKIKIFKTPGPQIFTTPESKIYNTPSIPITKENEKKCKPYHTPDSTNITSYANNTKSSQKIYKTPEQNKIRIKFSFNNFIKDIELNEVESLERQCKTIKEAFNIKNENNIKIFDNSDEIDKKRSPKELEWRPDMKIEVGIDN